MSGEFDGFDLNLFDDPEIEPPDITEPFFAAVDLDPIIDVAGEVTGFTQNHRGSVNLPPRDSDFQSAAYQTRSRVTFRAEGVTPGAPPQHGRGRPARS